MTPPQRSSPKVLRRKYENAFAERMTQKAHKLGMASTTYRNASGLPDPAQKTTARDLAVLAPRASIETSPITITTLRRANSLFTAPWHGQPQSPHEPRSRAWTAIKTGYIRASGFNLAAIGDAGQSPPDRRRHGLATSAQRARRTAVAYLLNTAFANP